MKKIIIFIALIAVIPILWGKEVKAFSSPDGNEYTYYYETNRYYGTNYHNDYDYKIWSNLKIVGQNFHEYSSGSYLVGLLDENTDAIGELWIGQYQNIPQIQSSTTFNSNGIINNRSLNGVVYMTTIAGNAAAGNSSVAIKPNDEYFEYANSLTDMHDLLTAINVDFDNVYYSPLIATPILTPYYTAYNESGINIPYVPLTFDLSNPNESYYLQIKQKNYSPSVVRVDGANKFNVLARNGFEVHDIYEMSDLIVSSDFSRNDFYDDISDNWSTDLNEFTFSNVQMINGLQSNIGSTADAYFLAQSTKFQQLRNIQTVYGNIIEIWARYFMIDENNNVVVGKWFHWWSLASDNFDEQLPEYVIPYEKAYGTENTTDQNNAPDGVGTTNGTGTSSNPNQNYTYVSVVPNYPDYPTIASYNKDNLLVDTITKMNDTKVFFGEFNQFLQASFIWIPEWIWGVIGVGFALSIIVFFLRML